MAATTDIAKSSMQAAFVLLIEGYDTVITNHDSLAAVVTAYAATDWATALGGLHVPDGITERLELFKGSMSAPPLSFVIAADDADTFGIATHKTADSSGNKSELSANIDVNDTTITPVSVTGFAAGAADRYIGTERFTAAVSGANFAVSVDGDGPLRGLYAPYKGQSETPQRFGRNHSITDLGVAVIRPHITDYQRTWAGKTVRLMVHSVTGGVLDTFANAYTAWSGTIERIEDKGQSTVVHCKSLLNTIGDQVLLQEQFVGKVKEGLYIKADEEFKFNEVVFSPTEDIGPDNAQDFTLAAGYYTAQEICDEVNGWLAGEKSAARILSKVILSLVGTGAGTRAKMLVTGLVSVADVAGSVRIWVPAKVADWLGFMDVLGGDADNPIVGINVEIVPHATLVGTERYKATGEQTPRRAQPFQRIQSYGAQLDLEETEGAWVDVADAWMPEGFGSFSEGDWGFLAVGDKAIWLAKYVSDTNFQEVQVNDAVQTLLGTESLSVGLNDSIATSVDDAGSLWVKQVVIMQGPTKNLLMQLLSSTGVTAYNGAYDLLDRQLGAAVPWEAMSTTFEDSLGAAAELYTPSTMTVVIDKSTPIRKFIQPELALRNASIVMDDGKLRVVRPSTPTTADPDITLTTNNKAGDALADDPNRTAAGISTDLVFNKFTVKYNRTMGDEYRESRTVANLASYTDLGEWKPVTIKARNTVGNEGPIGDVIESLLSNLGAVAIPLFSHPVTVLTRTIDRTLFASAIPGKTVTITDDSARDPETGTRGMVEWPAFILETSKDWLSGIGQVTLVMASHHGKGAFTIYSPSARIDPDTAANYNVGQTSFVTDANIFTISTDTPSTDMAAFGQTDEVRIIEESPPNTAAPSTFIRTLATVGTNAFTTAATSLTVGKTYYVVSDDRASAQTSQQSDAYIADKTDGFIQDTVLARRWGDSLGPTPTIGAPDLTVRHRFPPDLEDDEGEPVSVLSHHSAFHTAQNLINYRASVQFPNVSGTLRTGTLFESSYTGAESVDWGWMRTLPIYYGSALSPGADVWERYLELGPLFYRASGSGTVKIRLTLHKTMMTGSSVADVTFVEPYQQATWSSTQTSATWGARTEIKRIGVLSDGTAYLTVEGQADNTEVVALVGIGEAWLSPMK